MDETITNITESSNEFETERAAKLEEDIINTFREKDVDTAVGAVQRLRYYLLTKSDGRTNYANYINNLHVEIGY